MTRISGGNQDGSDIGKSLLGVPDVILFFSFGRYFQDQAGTAGQVDLPLPSRPSGTTLNHSNFHLSSLSTPIRNMRASRNMNGIYADTE